MEYKTEDGTVLTDELLDRMAEEYERGTWTGSLGSVSMGRPKFCEEELQTVSFRLPKSRIIAIEEVVKRKGETKSEFFREAVDRLLAEA